MALDDLGANETSGLVCAHHHLYSALAPGMPAPPRTPASFRDILELVWWRLDRALDLEMLEWSAKLGALEAIESGTTAIVDHHESPNAIEGSLDVIANACAEVGVRVNCSYGVTDRHGKESAQRGLEENRRYLASGGTGMVGVHAAFTCESDTLLAASELAQNYGVGVHIHVAEGTDDLQANDRLKDLSRDDWLLVHGVHLEEDHGLNGCIVHNPRSNMNNSVGYAAPHRLGLPIALGTDGIGAAMLDEFRIAYARLREHDVAATPELPWSWLETGYRIIPEAVNDRVTWSHGPIDPWRLAFQTNIKPQLVEIDGEVVYTEGELTRADAMEIRTKAAEQAQRLFAKLENMV